MNGSNKKTKRSKVKMARTDNKLYFYKKTANWSSAKEIGYLKCNDFDKLLGQVTHD